MSAVVSSLEVSEVVGMIVGGFGIRIVVKSRHMVEIWWDLVV